MRKLLLGLIVLGSFSTYASEDCSLNLGDLEFKGKQLRILKSKYDLTTGQARFSMDITGMCMGGACDAGVHILENGSTFDSGVGSEEINHIIFRGNILPKLGEKSIKQAIQNLSGCK